LWVYCSAAGWIHAALHQGIAGVRVLGWKPFLWLHPIFFLDVFSLISQLVSEKEEYSCRCQELPGKHGNFYSHSVLPDCTDGWVWSSLTDLCSQLLGKSTGGPKLPVKKVLVYPSRGMPARWCLWVEEDHCLIILVAHLTLCVTCETGFYSE